MTDSRPAGALASGNRRSIQHRTVLALALGQLFSAIGLSSTLTVSSLMALELTGDEALAGTPTTALAIGGALGALPLSALAVRSGRRAALASGLGAAAAGSVLLLFAPVWQSYPALLAGAFLMGFGFAANLQSRFAATDLAEDATRARDLGLVVWAITVGAVAGPNLVGLGSEVGTGLGLPHLSGPFLLAVAGLLAAVLVLLVGLRPDPLLAARELAQAPPKPLPGFHPVVAGFRGLRDSAAARLGVGTIVAAHLTMVAVMAMTPVHLQHLATAAGAGLGAVDPSAARHTSADTLVLVGLVISLHVAGMFGLSPLMGWLADRYGCLRLMAAAQVLFAVAVVTAGIGQATASVVAAGVVLLGLAWSMATVAASAYIAESVHGQSAVPVQGVSDMLMGVAGALGSAVGGVLLAVAGFRGLNLSALAVVLAAAVVLGTSLVRARSSANPAAGPAAGRTGGP